jgi:gluconate 5-dehydrogenase
VVDKSVIVTGGAGHLGSAISKGLAARGAHVVALGRTRESLDRLASEAAELLLKGTLRCVSCDVGDPAQFAEVVSAVVAKHDRIDVLVNNAHSARREPWGEMTLDAWRAGLQGSLDHYFVCAHAVSRAMSRAGEGSIINNASIWAHVAPTAGMHLDLDNKAPVHYAAAKGAVVSMTRFLAAELAPHGVRVNSFSPGFFPKQRGPERPDFIRAITSRVPLARIGQPEDLVGVVTFLASRASAYVTGADIMVDGGYSIL